MIAPETSAFYSEPGVYSPAQLVEWKKITDAEHAKGGKIFAQIWHAGRVAHPAMNGGAESVAPSAISIDGVVHTPNVKAPHATPRALRMDELPGIVAQFATATRNAVDIAGFDRVEIHALNGYLIDQFLRDCDNTRMDAYGGSVENRARFLLEVVDAVVSTIGADRVDSDVPALTMYIATRMNDLALAYEHVVRGDFQVQKDDQLGLFRRHYKGTLVANLAYTQGEAGAAITAGDVDAVAFGSPFIANPDLVARFRTGGVLNTLASATFYTGGASGYTDYAVVP
ncbi:12-oxophytodienoate reductase [Achlya hypogyna]|uniref:12-oxophytodienoate reductase n=1 Tax=Achlya hypogyna TaxID=1202772 RepID=A0A1V9Z4T8_ACHHY|nr:12-oxophytodienoate reductase [Achlya hypogyna]